MRIINRFVSSSDKLKSGFLGGISLFVIVFMVSAITLSSGILAEASETEVESFASPDGIGIMAHTATATLEPEWSPANTSIDYTAEICVDSDSDPVDEVRIYRHMNEKSTYTDFVCEAKDGWSLTYIEIGDRKESCLYVAQEEDSYIEGGSCETFEFSATTPELIPDLELCGLEWRLETRDTVEQWKEQTVYTSVDDVAPEVEKTIMGDHYGYCPPEAEEECWIRQYPDSNISIEVKDQGKWIS